MLKKKDVSNSSQHELFLIFTPDTFYKPFKYLKLKSIYNI